MEVTYFGKTFAQGNNVCAGTGLMKRALPTFLRPARQFARTELAARSKIKATVRAAPAYRWIEYEMRMMIGAVVVAIGSVKCCCEGKAKGVKLCTKLCDDVPMRGGIKLGWQ
ncbi:hypothetical protein ASE72_18745 [Sphingomonas sp. Leaf20]|nr:hypothetical protein ASE72_18745 [Sphingomonas sp. Leaf20]